MTRLFICIFFVLLIPIIGNAQDTRNVRNPTAPVYQNQKKAKKKFFLLKVFQKDKTDLEEFRERMKDVYKQKAKEEKLAEKPQYSNPLYFGHRRPPKKRPPGKQKYCKICKIKH